MLRQIAIGAVLFGGFAVSADAALAQSYYSRQATQNRDYQRLQQATQRAYAPVKPTTTYRAPVRTQTYKPATSTTAKRNYR